MTIEDDLLAPFRMRGARPAFLPAQQQTGYKACTVALGGAKPSRLDIRPRDGLAVSRPYSAFLEIAYDRGDYTGILFVLNGKLIKIRGKDLRPVVEALLSGTCEALTEIAEGDRVEDGVPVIERIETVTPQAKSTPISKAEDSEDA